ncbi:MAG: hypothetical protein EOP45_16320 [Sphingobacteriaceae bacterium]|nr:MAG: hypothetical protein EOP45_16320 [Sphingobacteriaceae bacterium]
MISLLKILLLFCCTSVCAQSGKVYFSGRLHTSYKNQTIHLANLDGLQVAIPIHSGNNFTFSADSLTKGFYELEEIGTVYLSPGYHLTVTPATKGSYLFAGSGAVENNALRSAKRKLFFFTFRR